MATNLLSFNISLLQQFTEPRKSVFLNSRNCQKVTINLHDGDILRYTQAEELSLATVYRSQQLDTAEQWLSCKKKKWGNAIPFPFPFSSFSPFPLPSPAAKRLPENQLRGLGEFCNLPQWGPVGSGAKPRQQTYFGVFLSLKIAPGGNIF